MNNIKDIFYLIYVFYKLLHNVWHVKFYSDNRSPNQTWILHVIINTNLNVTCKWKTESSSDLHGCFIKLVRSQSEIHKKTT